MDLGLMVEGVVELDPLSGRMVLRIPQADGSNQFLDIQEHLARYRGQEVRFICTPLAEIAKLAQMIESGEVLV